MPDAVPCANCGTAFRAAYTGGRCPICDTAVAGDGVTEGRLTTLIGDRWTMLLFGILLAGNLVIAILVIRAVG
jgi:hypothetical protein